MKSWKFLIQKEGDHQWVPIPTSTFEIEPGIYRILASSNRLNKDIEVRISHQTSTGEDYAHDREHYSCHVNPQGLVIIFPFRELSTGIWEIHCRSDIMSELLGETWQETLKLIILDTVTNKGSFMCQKNCFVDSINRISRAKKTKDLSQSNRHKKSETYHTPYINNSSDEAARFYLNQLNKLIQEKVEPLINNYETNIQQNLECFPKLSSSHEIIEHTFQLILNQDIFQGNPNESVTISGKIKSQNTENKLALTARISYQLKHPYTNEIIMKMDDYFFYKTLPFTFHKALVIPDKLEGLPCLLGEVSLHTMTGVTITHCPFQIYSRGHYPVDYTIELFDTEHKYSYQFEFKVIGKTRTESTAIELPITSKNTHILTESLSLCNQILPPKLNKNSNSLKVKRKSLNLPQVISN